MNYRCVKSNAEDMEETNQHKLPVFDNKNGTFRFKFVVNYKNLHTFE